MKIAVIVIVAVVVAAAGIFVGVGYASARGTGPVVAEDRPVLAFTRVEVSGSGTLILSTSAEPGVRIEAQRNILDRIKTEVSPDGTLHIGSRAWWMISWFESPVTYRVSTSTLAGLSVSGSVGVRGEGTLRAQDLEIRTSGSSGIDLQLDVQTLRNHNSGSAQLTLAGAAGAAVFESSGSARISAAGLACRTATVDSSGSCELALNVSDRLDVDISGSGKVAYSGDPQVNSHGSGSARVSRVGQ